MLIHRLRRPFAWPAEAIPLAAIERDWHGAPLVPPARWALALDDERLWLLAVRAAPAAVHPAAVPGAFTSDLWRFDAAELFLGRAGDAAYLELNLAPNGAWWSCEFTAPRVRRRARDVPLPGVRTEAAAPDAGGWRAALGVPLAALGEASGLADGTTANVAFVVAGPTGTFASAAPPPAGPPDFHAPGLRRPVRVVAGP